jgi:putative heme-binding domain-containing protein
VDEDRRKWFRPSDVTVGADGAVYVADWFDPIVGGHQMHELEGYGRIYRITPKGRTLTTPAVDMGTVDGLLSALRNPSVNVRASGFAALRAKGEAALSAARTLLSDPNPFHRARAIWLLGELGPAGVRDVQLQLSDRDPQIRIAALRALRTAKRGDVLEEARRLAEDPSAAVRREVALSLRGVPIEHRREIFLTLAERFDGTDRWYLEALGTAASGHEGALYASLLHGFRRPDPLRWDERLAALAWRLHPVEAIDALAQRAASSRLTLASRRQALVALGFIDDPRSARAMARLTHSTLPDVATQATWWMTYRTTNDWRDYAVDGWTPVASDARPPVDLDETRRRRSLVLDAAAPIDGRIDAALAMAGDGAGAPLLIELAANNRLPGMLRDAVGSVIFSNADRSVRAAAAGFFPRPGGRSRMTVAGAASRAGDPVRGETRFAGSCSTCHHRGVDSPGAGVGPDLSGIEKKFDRRALLEAIVEPSAGIAFGFEAELFVTRRGAAHIGFLQSDGATISIRDGYGVVRTIDRGDLDARVPLKSSLMPDPLALGLSEQDVADVAAYLMRGR